MSNPEQVPLWLTLAYACGVPVIAAVYWHTYGPTNFLWLSDVALAFTLAALITGNPLLASMPAVGVLPLELAWTVDFLTGGRILGLAAYMFDSTLPLYLRSLSLFHLALPPTLLFLLSRLEYDGRALILQMLLTWLLLIVSYLATDPEKNVNWVFGPGSRPQQVLPPLLYFGIELVVISLVLMLTHVILKRVF